MNALNLNFHREGELCRAEVPEKMVAATVDAQREAFLKALEDPPGVLILDLSRTELIDSLGITLLLGIFKTCVEKKIRFEVEGVSPDILRVFKLFSLSRLFPVREAP